MFQRRYATATAPGTHLRLPLLLPTGAFAGSGDWTPAVGDVKISLDGGSNNNIATLPVYSNGAWTFALSSGELTCKSALIQIIDAALQSDAFVVETFGDPSALQTWDPSATYHAEVALIVSDSAGVDKYRTTWFKNGIAITSGITVPTIQVVRDDATSLISSSTPAQIGSTGVYKLDASTTSRLQPGDIATAVVTATIDGATRTWKSSVGRNG